MRKYLVLTFVSLLSAGVVGYFYIHSQSRLESTYAASEQNFFLIKESDTVLETNTLQLKDFLLQNYDSIVVQENFIESFCAQPTDAATLDDVGLDFIFAHDSYCKELTEKIRNVEMFKSRAAIYRNSVFYLHQRSIELDQASGTLTPDRVLVEDLIDAAILYSLLSNDVSRKQLGGLLQRSELSVAHHKIDHFGLAEIVGHARHIYDVKPLLDHVTKEILNGKTQTLWQSMREAYLVSFQNAERNAQGFRKLLFGSCIILFMFIILNILNLWRAARDLEQANATLESRVTERTKELTSSQKIITEQQQALMSSAKMSALGEMAGGVAHEINTPLATIQLRTDQLIEYIEEGERDPVAFMEALKGIEATVRRIANIVQGLRSFARDGRRDPMVASSLEQIITDTFGLCRERFQNHGVRLDFHCDDLMILCRPTEISQVLLNLLNNAFDAIMPMEKKWIRVEAYAKDGKALITVVDCGGGIPPEIQQKLMQPFFTTKEPGKGTGLGLSISRGIIDSHGGSLAIDPAHNNTCFVIKLPTAA